MKKRTHEVSALKIFAPKSLKCECSVLRDRGGHFAVVLHFNSYICIETLTFENSFKICWCLFQKSTPWITEIVPLFFFFWWSSPAVKKTKIAQLILQLSVCYSYCVDRPTDEMSPPCFWVWQCLWVTALPPNLVCGHCVLSLELLKKVGIDLKLHVHFFRKRVAKGQRSFNLSSEYCWHFLC